jgi:NitT/TauT family transport system substrate-binding protein
VWPTYLVTFIAQEQGLFTKYGVEVDLVLMDTLTGSLDIYKSNEVDGAFMVYPDAIMLDAESTNSRIVYSVNYSDTGDLIVGNPLLDNLGDLKGKTVSFEGLNTFSHFFVMKFLEKAGVLEGQFKTANLENAKVVEALDAGDVQAGHVYGVPASQALKKGYKILAKAGELPHSFVEVLIFHAQVVEKRRDDIQKFTNALVEALAFLREHPSEACRIMAKFSSVSKTELEEILNAIKVFSLEDNKQLFKPQGPLYESGQEIIDFFYKKGGIVKIPNLKQMIDGQFVENIGDKP